MQVGYKAEYGPQSRSKFHIAKQGILSSEEYKPVSTKHQASTVAVAFAEGWVTVANLRVKLGVSLI